MTHVRETETETASLLKEIEAFLAETGMGPVYFGKAAGGGSNLVARLRNGGDCYTTTAAKIREFMAQRRAERAQRKEKALATAGSPAR